MHDGAEGDGAGEEGGVFCEHDGQSDEVGELVCGLDGFGGVNVVGGDGGGVVFWAGAGGFLFDGGKDEVGAGTVEVDGAPV